MAIKSWLSRIEGPGEATSRPSCSLEVDGYVKIMESNNNHSQFTTDGMFQWLHTGTGRLAAKL